jgi:hypothetical protein
MKRWFWIYSGVTVLYWAVFWSQSLWLDADGNLMAGHLNIWGDWAAHFTMGHYLSLRLWQWQESPFLFGARFSYPFLTNWLSGLILSYGGSLWTAFVLPSFLFCVGGFMMLWIWFSRWLKSDGWTTLAAVLFLTSGGVGWWFFGADILQSAQPLSTLINPPHEYTKLDVHHIRWMSVIESMWIPQRAFQAGFPLGLLILWLLGSAWQLEKEKASLSAVSHKKLLLAGCLWALLTLVHTHSWLAVGVIGGCWGLSTLVGHRTRLISALLKWCWFLVPGLLGSWVLFSFFFASHVSGAHFLTWYPGWLAREYKMNWLWFWWLNWSYTPALAVVAAWEWIRHFKQVKWLEKSLLILPFFLLFAGVNLFLFQPYSWDNTKILVWVSLGFALLNTWWLQQHWLKSKKYSLWTGKVIRLGLIFLFLGVSASGAIDAYWELRSDLHSYEMYSAEELQLAKWAKANTSPNSVWLTSDQHNHWVTNLTGRRILMAYRGWLWSHGYQHRPTEKDVGQMFTQPAQSKELFEKYGIDYVVVGPSERNTWKARESELEKLFTVSTESTEYRVYATAP